MVLVPIREFSDHFKHCTYLSTKAPYYTDHSAFPSRMALPSQTNDIKILLNFNVKLLGRYMPLTHYIANITSFFIIFIHVVFPIKRLFLFLLRTREEPKVEQRPDPDSLGNETLQQNNKRIPNHKVAWFACYYWTKHKFLYNCLYIYRPIWNRKPQRRLNSWSPFSCSRP